MSSVATTPHSLPAGGEEGRAFLQERLALLGKVICLIVIGFYVVGNLAAIPLPEFEWISWVAHGSNRLMLAVMVVSGALWRFSRGPARPLRVLEAADAGGILLLCGLVAMLALFPFEQDSDGEVVSRSLLAILMTLVTRSVIVPSPAGRAAGDRLERFEREVQLTSRLNHPNTVAVFDYGRTADGVFYYAMEYLEGLNLDDLVRVGGAQPAGRVVHVLRQVAGALVEAHGVGLIHRDIKPANVILLPEYGAAADVAKVVDFGLVKELEGRADLTRDDQIAGTPLYLSPEAIRAPDLVDARSDLYSLGAVGYFLLTGTPVFPGRNAVEVCGHHLHTPPVPPAERLDAAVPAKLSSLLIDCLRKDAEERPASAREMIARLDACTDVPAWTEEEARSWWRRFPPAEIHTSRSASPGSSVMTLSALLGGRQEVGRQGNVPTEK